jgi:hypothetical protein
MIPLCGVWICSMSKIGSFFTDKKHSCHRIFTYFCKFLKFAGMALLAGKCMVGS